jgi:general secretion pathway protein A
MHYHFFGLKKNPFGMTPDPAFLFLTPQHREALAGLTYAILGRKGFLVLTGDAGTGKTTLLARVLAMVPEERLRFSLILNPTLTAAEFLEMTLLDFGIESVPPTKPQRLATLERLLLEADRQGKACALIIDEAHKLQPEVFEEIRLLGNFEQQDRKLLQVLFSGQDELAGILNRPDLRQLKQRVATRFAIGPLASEEVGEYIQFRWSKAGGAQAPFGPDAVHTIVFYSNGIPRLINALCDNALIVAFGEGAKAVRASHVLQSAQDLDLTGQAPVAGRPQEPALAGPPPLSASLPTLSRYATQGNSSFLAKWATKSRGAG